MNICIVDDEVSQLNYLTHLIGKWAKENKVEISIVLYKSAEEMLFEHEKSYPFDMIILDVQMGKMNGISLAKRIRETDKTVVITFVTGVGDYVFEGYEVHAYRYVLKPIQEVKLFEILDYVQMQLTKDSNYLIVSVSGEKKKINYDDITYIVSMGHYLTIHLQSKEYDVKYNIGDLCQELDGTEFVRTHRSYIVNMKYVEKITRSECELINNIIVPLSRNSYKSVNKKFIEYYNGKGV